MWNNNGNLRVRTWDGGAEQMWIQEQKLVLQSPPPHTLGTNQNQSFPLERRHFGHLFIQQYFMSVKLCDDEGKNERSHILVKKGREKIFLCENFVDVIFLPAFLVVTYIIFFFFFPPTPVQRFPVKKKNNKTQ